MLQKEITQLEHTLLAVIILFTLYQLCFHMFLKHHPVTHKNIQEYKDMFNNLLNK
jgi:hypothetical protein